MTECKSSQSKDFDKSGKATSIQTIKEELESKGYKVATSEFHRYDTPTGELIMQWLTKQWDVSQKTIELIMAADKQAQQEYFARLEMLGYDYLILDRYIHSQYAYGLATGSELEWLDELLYHVREPNVVIYIDVDAETSMSRKGKHNNGVNDRYEEDKRLLENVRYYYLGLVEEDEDGGLYDMDVFKINGMQPIEDVQKDIRKLLQSVVFQPVTV